MKAWFGFQLTVIALLSTMALASTDQVPLSAKKGPKRPVTIKGEVLDLSCYLSRGLAGPLHRDCARRCIASGVPMGIMGPDSTVWLLTPDHGRAMTPTGYTTPNPYVLCKDWASLTVEVNGMASIRNGVRVIEVSQGKLVPAPTSGSAP